MLDGVGHVVIRVSAETSDPKKFAEMFGDALRSHARLREPRARWTKELGGEVSVTVGVAGLTLSGKTASPTSHAATPEVGQLELFREIAQTAAPYRVVLILDELTVLAAALGESTAGGATAFRVRFDRFART